MARKSLSILRCRRYIQNHTLQTDFDGLLKITRGFTVEPFDDVVGLWLDSIQDLEEAFGSPECARAQDELLEDERKLILSAHQCVLPRSTSLLIAEMQGHSLGCPCSSSDVSFHPIAGLPRSPVPMRTTS